MVDDGSGLGTLVEADILLEGTATLTYDPWTVDEASKTATPAARACQPWDETYSLTAAIS